MVAIYDVQNASEFVTATDGEQFGNPHVYGVLTGCGVTESGANMNVTVAAGVALYQGGPVTVAGATVALVADSSNLRWAYVYIDSTGTPQVALGDPAPNAQTEPSKPAVTGAILKAYKVQPGQTVAANVAIAIDKAVQAHPLTYVSRTTSNFTKNNNDSFTNVTGLSFPIGDSEVWSFAVYAQASIGATPDIKLQFTAPSGAAATGNASKLDAAGIASVRVSDWLASNALTSAAAGVGLILTGTVVNSTTAGTVQLQAAQNSATVEDTIIYSQSYLIAWRVA